MFIILTHYLKPLPEVDKVRSAHVEYMKPFFESGKLFLAGRKVPVTGAVIISKNVTREELDVIFRHDPYVLNQLLEYQIIEFTPTAFAPSAKAENFA